MFKRKFRDLSEIWNFSGNLPVSQYVTDINAQFWPHNFLAQILKEAKQLLRLALNYISNRYVFRFMLLAAFFKHLAAKNVSEFSETSSLAEIPWV